MIREMDKEKRESRMDERVGWMGREVNEVQRRGRAIFLRAASGEQSLHGIAR